MPMECPSIVLMLLLPSAPTVTKAIVVASIRNAYDDAKIDIEVVGRYRDGGAAEIRVVKTRDVIAKISRHVGGHYIVEVGRVSKPACLLRHLARRPFCVLNPHLPPLLSL